MKLSILILTIIFGICLFAAAGDDKPTTTMTTWDDDQGDDDDDEPIVGGYTPLVWDGEDQELVDLLDWGVQEAVWEAIASGELDDGEWHWTEVNSVSSQLVDGTNYDFDVDIINDEGQTADLDLIIFDQPRTDTKAVVEWDVDNEDNDDNDGDDDGDDGNDDGDDMN